MRIGIYAPNWIGDAVLSLPFLNRCRRSFPKAHITVIAKTRVAAIFMHHPSIDSTVPFSGAQLKGFFPTTHSGRSLRAADFDRFYLLSDSLRSAYLAWLARIQERIGFRGQFRAPFLSQSVSAPGGRMHRADRYLRLLGDSATAEETAAPGITLTKNESSWAVEQLAQLHLTEPIAVFISSVAESRRVPLAKWTEILEPYFDDHQEILFIGSQQDRPDTEVLVERLNRPGVVTVCGQTTLRQAMALISKCRGALATDSGLGHIAANLGIRTISIFGAGDPKVTRPLGSRAAVISEAVHCSPCRKNVCLNRDEPLLCLSVIPTKAVWESYHAL
ncbi:MAG: lipopolysaccharide heptosyltransferase II [Fidelibacterota bacterium]|nr:MAG: lipopolysaccharide heptosyltransferase II [Candidatus Neomarinimicrobiota bacterium]